MIMLKEDINRTVLLSLIFINGLNSCNFEICFTWKVSPDNLTLICKVHSLKYRVRIQNPYHIQVADCFPAFGKSICDSTYKNGTIHQDKKSKTTVYTVNGTIDNHVNGIWTCIHGTKIDNATVDVTVFIHKEYKVNHSIIVRHNNGRNGVGVNYSEPTRSNQVVLTDYGCIFHLLLSTFVCYFGFMILICCIIKFADRCCNLRLDETICVCSYKCYIFCVRKFEAETAKQLIRIFSILIPVIIFGLVVIIVNIENCSSVGFVLCLVPGGLLGILSSTCVMIRQDETANEIPQVIPNNDIQGDDTPSTSCIPNLADKEDDGATV
ncbi:uncharacterized protein LOC127704907 [Mytilus californianus]|uniref:uncharacterized protein LOC127704907 n=1 Tax=Mytilus californianus TaxID=6549 RepID=UPI0022466D79|nr:uncharacterized protein LOC127704907 [Mytilus californianus]